MGRKIVIIANLAPRKMRGLESRGMLLAASEGEGGKPVLATFWGGDCGGDAAALRGRSQAGGEAPWEGQARQVAAAGDRLRRAWRFRCGRFR